MISVVVFLTSRPISLISTFLLGDLLPFGGFYNDAQIETFIQGLSPDPRPSIAKYFLLAPLTVLKTSTPLTAFSFPAICYFCVHVQ